jgi:hypothetical protein
VTVYPVVVCLQIQQVRLPSVPLSNQPQSRAHVPKQNDSRSRPSQSKQPVSRKPSATSLSEVTAPSPPKFASRASLHRHWFLMVLGPAQPISVPAHLSPSPSQSQLISVPAHLSPAPARRRFGGWRNTAGGVDDCQASPHRDRAGPGYVRRYAERRVRFQQPSAFGADNRSVHFGPVNRR